MGVVIYLCAPSSSNWIATGSHGVYVRCDTHLDVKGVGLSQFLSVACVLEADAVPASANEARIGRVIIAALHPQIRMII